MKLKKLAVALLTVGAAAVVASVALRSGALPGTESVEDLGRALGIWSLFPPVFAVVLAFLTGNVVLSLFAGVIAGFAMLTAIGGGPLFYGTFHSAVEGIIDTATDWDNTQVLILCVMVGGMEGVIRLSGGFEAAARKLAGRLKSRRKVNLLCQAFCTLFFFDDYANALISGPVLRPVTDKAGVSREKLSYIVDSTAAPLAGIAVISSWVAVEVSVIQEGLDAAGVNASAFQIFFHSIPYCFYCVFALAFILLLTVMGREYGPMLEAERRAMRGKPRKPGTKVAEALEHLPSTKAKDKGGRRIALAFGCIALLLIFALVMLYVTGRSAAVAEGLVAADAPFRFGDLSTVMGSADTIQLVLEAALLCSIAAILAGALFLKLFTLYEGVEAWLEGASSLLTTIVVLVLAWALAGVVEKLGTVYFVVDVLSGGFPKVLIPTLIFVVCCVISFAAGSYGCMFMVMPIAIPIVAAVSGIGENPAGDPFMLSCVAAVLSGGIFGDHCSPMTDCTILAALGAECETMDHVKTQMPYALTVAAASVLCGTLLTSFGVPAWLALIIGVTAMGGVVIIAGKKP